MKLRVNKKGYLRVGLWADGATKQRMYAVHRLIATLFVPNPLKLPEVNHEDRVKTNNYYKNLSWCTGSQNMQHWADTTDFSFRHTPVYCYHPNWELLKRFESQKQAKEELGIKHQSIQQSLRSNGRVKARGYRFTLEPIIDLQSYPTSS